MIKSGFLSNMNWIDYVIIIVISCSCLLGLIRGFIYEILSLVTWCCSFFISSYYYTDFSYWFTNFQNELARDMIAILLVFITIFIIGIIINFFINQLIERTGFSVVNRMIGMFFGILRGVLIVSSILLFFDHFTDFQKRKDWKKSYLVPQFIWFLDYLKELLNFL